MANQKYTGMKILRLLLWLLVLSMAIPSTIPSNYCHSQFSNVNYPIAVTLGANPNYSVVSTNGILRNPKSIAVTVIADGKSKVYGDEILRLLLWLLVLSMAIPSTIP
jgi:hypothetical protein